MTNSREAGGRGRAAVRRHVRRGRTRAVVSIPLPAPDAARLDPPDGAEVELLSRGVLSAISVEGHLTPIQDVLMEAVFEAMTGHPFDRNAAHIEPIGLATGLADRNEAFRTRILQIMLLGALVLRPLPTRVAAQLDAYAEALSVGDGMLDVARRYAEGSLGLAAFDFERNGYTKDWTAEKQRALHTSKRARRGVGAVPPRRRAGRSGGGRSTIWQRERSDGGSPSSIGPAGSPYPGAPGSAPPLLAQHDWVHVLTDYGTKVESELEVFAFVARANDDPKGFSLLAMVVSLFETGYLRCRRRPVRGLPRPVVPRRGGGPPRRRDASRRTGRGQRRLHGSRLVRTGRPPGR